MLAIVTAYRVQKVTNNGFAREGESVTAETVWEGEDIRALSELHPPSEVRGADHFHSASIEDGWITWSFKFEKLENGVWVDCPDPRRRLNPEWTDLELAIDRENRRLFPGDYHDLCDDEDPENPFDGEYRHYDPYADDDPDEEVEFYRGLSDSFDLDDGYPEDWEAYEDDEYQTLDEKLRDEAYEFGEEMMRYLARKYYRSWPRNY